MSHIRVTAHGIYVAGQERLSVDSSVITATELQFFLHNWIQQFLIRTAFLTDVFQATTLAEERKSLLDRPDRDVTINLTGLKQIEVLQIEMALNHAAIEDTLWPLYPDFTELTTEATSSQNDLVCDVTFRRFFPGAKVLLVQFESTGREVLQTEFGVIDKVKSDRITLVDSLTNTFALNSRVYPLFVARVQLDTFMQFPSDSTIDLQFTLSEVSGPSALARLTVDQPSSFTTRDLDGVPIFDLQRNWSQSITKRLRRTGTSTPTGRSVLTSVLGDRALSIYDLEYLKLNRADSWELLKFFDWARGRFRAFWFVSPETVFNFNAISQTSVSVVEDVPKEDLRAFMEHVAIVMKDGTIYIREVATVITVAGNNIILWSDVIPVVLLADIDRVTFGNLVRFDQDAIEELWMANESIMTSLSLAELTNEKTTPGGCINPIFNITLTSPPDPPPLMWLDAALHVFEDVNREVALVATEEDIVGFWDDVRASPSAIPFVRDSGVGPLYVANQLFPGSAAGGALGRMPQLQFPSTAIAGHFDFQNGKFWGTDFTVFCVFGNSDNTGPHDLFRISEVSGSPGVVFNMQDSRNILYSAADTIEDDRGTGTPAQSASHVRIMEFSEGSHCKNWLNGGANVPNTGSITIPGSAPYDFELATAGRFQISAFVVFDAILPVATLNELGQYFTDRFQCEGWTTIV